MGERRTQAERRAESRQRLIDAAIELLASRGYAGASLVEIGRAAGLSRGLVNHHFGSKEACMREVAHDIRERVRRTITATPLHGPDAVDRLIDVYFELLRTGDPGSRAMYVILMEGITSTPGLRPTVADTNAAVRTFIADTVAQLVEPGDREALRPTFETIAVLMESLFRGVALQWLADPGAIDLDAAIAMTKGMIHREIAAARVGVD